MSSPLHTRIWREEPEADNAFAPRAAYCHGYDVFGQMLGRASWADMLFLLFRGEAPSPTQARLLETLAVTLANPGPRDPMVHAAMCGGVGGSHAAASLMAALAVGAGQSGGAREVRLAMRAWADCDGLPAPAWPERLARCEAPAFLAFDDAGWPAQEHPAGFDPHGASTATTVQQALACLAGIQAETASTSRLSWLHANRLSVEAAAGLPLAMTGVAAAALADLGFDARQAEMLCLLLRLPGAAAHALEQADYGFKRFPYPEVHLEDDPLHAHANAAPAISPSSASSSSASTSDQAGNARARTASAT